MTAMPFAPTLYQCSAAYYASGRPPYSRDLVPALAAEVGLDGSGRLLDVGCGPGMVVEDVVLALGERPPRLRLHALHPHGLLRLDLLVERMRLDLVDRRHDFDVDD